MFITKIEPQKKHKNRSSVFLDGHFAFGISCFDVLRLGLKEGQEISDEKLDNLRKEVLTQDARQYALRLLDHQNYTEKALRLKMKDRSCDPAAIENTVAFLKDYGYLDDASYARNYLSAALRSGKSGLKKIQYDLQEKGISRDILQEISAEFDNDALIEDEQKAVVPLLLKKLKGDFSFPSIMKAKRYCLSRGFSLEAIDRALTGIKAMDDEWLDD